MSKCIIFSSINIFFTSVTTVRYGRHILVEITVADPNKGGFMRGSIYLCMNHKKGVQIPWHCSFKFLSLWNNFLSKWTLVPIYHVRFVIIFPIFVYQQRAPLVIILGGGAALKLFIICSHRIYTAVWQLMTVNTYYTYFTTGTLLTWKICNFFLRFGKTTVFNCWIIR